MRNIITTIGGLVLVGAIVVATFLYGNHQHQEQLRKDQAAQRASQEQQTQKQTAQTSTPSDTHQQPAVQKPAQNSIQGSKDQAASPAPAPAPAASQSQPSETPKTGGEMFYVLGATLMAMLALAYRRSRLAVKYAAVNVKR